MIGLKKLAEFLFNRQVSDVGSDTEEGAPTKSTKNDTVPTVLGFLLPALGFAFIYLIYLINAITPSQVQIREERDNPNRFIGERAEQYLKGLIDIGPKVTGSDNLEIKTTEYITNIIKNISENAIPSNTIELDVQHATGAFYLEEKPYGFIDIYEEITNIVVKFSANKNSNTSILVNCHTDTVFLAPGAADNGMNCAILLEVINKLSKQKFTSLKHNIIFLFNGAEENALQGAHGFIAHHKWANECIAVINLDAAGSGGRDILFQVSSHQPWLINLYTQAVPHPNGAVTFAEVYETNFLPSYTDYLTFDDNFHVPTINMAHVDNGFIYHTRMDKPDYIAQGAYQNTGDNVLELAKLFANSSFNVACGAEETYVYFDFLGLFMVVYSQSLGLYLNTTIIIVSLMTIVYTLRVLPEVSKNPIKHFSYTVLIQVLSLLLTLAITLVLAVAIDLFKSSMGWFSHRFFITVMYGLPLYYGTCILPYILHEKYKPDVSRGEFTVANFAAAQFILTVILILLTIVGLRSAYLVLFILGIPVIANSLLIVFRVYTVRSAIISYLIFSIPGITIAAYVLVRLFIILIPMTGRTGVSLNPDLVIAAITFVFGYLMTSLQAPVLQLLKHPLRLSFGLFLINVAAIVVIISTSFGFPFSGDTSHPTLQRFTFLYTNRVFYDIKGNIEKQDVGYAIQNTDRHDIQYVSQVVPALTESLTIQTQAPNEVYWGFPIYYARNIPSGHWLSSTTNTAVIRGTDINAVSYTPLGKNRKRVLIRAVGPDHLTLLVAPRANVTLFGWSFGDDTPPPGIPFNGRPTYEFFYTTTRATGSVNFTLDFESTSSSPILADIAVVGHHQNDAVPQTQESITLQSKFPSWTNVQSYPADFVSRPI